MRPELSLDKLLLLTLNLEEALHREAFDEADSLFRQRDIAMDAVALLNVSRSHPTVMRILEADARIGLFLATRSQETVAEIRKVQSHGRAQRAYSHAA